MSGPTSTSRKRPEVAEVRVPGASGSRRPPVLTRDLRTDGLCVLGLDPGSSATGYGVVIFHEGCLRLERCGVWRPAPALPFSRKLEYLLERASELVGECRPAAVSIETVFADKNVRSTVKLSHARGVLLAAAGRFEVPVFEYEPRRVKKAIVGYGQADKAQVRAMVLTLLARHRMNVPLDAADALAVAICHVHAAPLGVV